MNRAITSAATAPFGSVARTAAGRRAALTIAGSVRPGRQARSRCRSRPATPRSGSLALLRHRLIRRRRGGDRRAPLDIDDLEPRPIATRRTTLLYTHRSPPLAAIVRADAEGQHQPVRRGVDAPELGGRARLPTNDAALDGLRKRLASWGVPPDARAAGRRLGPVAPRRRLRPRRCCLLLQRMYDPTGNVAVHAGAARRRRGRLAGQRA